MTFFLEDIAVGTMALSLVFFASLFGILLFIFLIKLFFIGASFFLIVLGGALALFLLASLLSLSIPILSMFLGALLLIGIATLGVALGLELLRALGVPVISLFDRSRRRKKKKKDPRGPQGS